MSELREILKEGLTSKCGYCHYTQIDNYKIDRTTSAFRTLLHQKVPEKKKFWPTMSGGLRCYHLAENNMIAKMHDAIDKL